MIRDKLIAILAFASMPLAGWAPTLPPPTNVPEPSALALFALGAGVLAARSLRKR